MAKNERGQSGLVPETYLEIVADCLPGAEEGDAGKFSARSDFTVLGCGRLLADFTAEADGELSVGLSCEVSEQTAAAQHSKVTSCRELARVAFLRAREAVSYYFKVRLGHKARLASLVLGHQPTVGRSDIEDSKVFACLEGELNLWAKPKE